MELQKQDTQYVRHKKIKFKDIIIGVMCILIPIVSALLIVNWNTLWPVINAEWKTIGKGILIGLCSLPVMLFIAIKLQDANFQKQKSDGYIHTEKSVRIGKSTVKKNTCLLVSFTLGILYSCYILGHFFGDYNNDLGETIAIAMVLPHIFMTLGATIINIIAYIKNTKGWALFAAILYSVAAILFLMYSPFVMPSIILCFVAWYKLKK